MLDEVQTVLVIDDHPLMRKGILQLIALEDSLCVVGEAGDGRQGLELARRLQPDLILLDLNMRGLSGLDTLKALKAADPDARVIVLTVSDSEDDVVAALRAGADGYLLKDMEPEDVLDSLKAAAQGRMVGHSNKLIARELKITEGTVKVHVKHLLHKLDLASRVEAAIWAVKSGFRK